MDLTKSQPYVADRSSGPAFPLTQTAHARIRAQQRRIPPLVQNWLEEFGDEQYDGFGGVQRYFSHASIKKMERALGREIVRHNTKFLCAYMVQGANDGQTITLGWRTKHVKRR